MLNDNIALSIGKYSYLACADNLTNTIDLNFSEWNEGIIRVRNRFTDEVIEEDFIQHLYDVLEHETLHLVLFKIEGYKAYESLDNPIKGKYLEWEITKERMEEFNHNLSQNNKNSKSLNTRSESILDKEVK